VDVDSSSAPNAWPAPRCLPALRVLRDVLPDAAQPLVTDDAAVVAPKTCQLEAWILAFSDAQGHWALAVQYMPIDRVQLLAELFRDEPGRSKYQAGLRFHGIPNRLDAYVSVGNRVGGASTGWWTIIGIRLQTAPFLP